MQPRPDISRVLMEQEPQYPFVRLAQLFAGLASLPEFSQSVEINQPQLEVAVARVGDVSILFPSLRASDGSSFGSSGISGACADERIPVAAVKAVAEAAERYAMTVLDNAETVVATANELGDSALDWRLFPRCLEREYAAFNGIVPFDPAKRMRWITGISLIDGRKLFIPVTLTHICAASRRAESFALPISTGVAVHTDVFEATSRAILEAVERDSIALTWYLRRALPRIRIPRGYDGPHAERFESFGRSQIRQYLFDATTDLGIPVVYGVMLAPNHPTVATVVTAAADLDPRVACGKAMREAVSTRLAVISSPEHPADPDACMKLEHGAAYMGHRDRLDAFDFLLGSPLRVSIDALANHDSGDSQRNLQWLIARLRNQGMEAVVVELTTDELRAAGMRAVRVVIPQLMPMSYVSAVRFLAHPRLYQYAEKVTGKPFSADMVNPFPQPFA
jgi:ribosomal protein S12 methylthiotransferase accessory factor